MKINYYNQPNDIRLGEKLNEKLKETFDEAYIFSGFAKDSGIYYLLPSLEDSGIGEITIALGIDNKNTSKDMLLKILNTGAKLRIYMNDDNSKAETRAYVFKKKNGNSYVYLSAAKLSEGGLLENESLVTEIIYSKEEKDLLDDLIQKLMIESGFKNITEGEIQQLASNGDIVARISERKIPRISEMYSQKEVEIGVKEYDESASSINMQDYDDVDISVELPSSQDVQVRNSLGTEVEQIIKKAAKKANINLEDGEESITSSKILPKEKEIDYEHMSTFMFVIQGADSTGIKIPNSMSQNISKFIDYPESYHMESVNGKLSECAKVVFEIFDNRTGNEATDNEAVLSRKDKYLAIESGILKALALQKDDIIRMMKKEKGKYRLEIIREGTDEHNIWENYCRITIKGSARKYGII